jgi:hypothetical protein
MRLQSAEPAFASIMPAAAEASRQRFTLRVTRRIGAKSLRLLKRSGNSA